MSRSWVAAVVASLCVVAVQLDIFSSVRCFGVVVMLVWLWSFCLGSVLNSSAATVIGAVVGLLFDAHVATPFGLNAVVCAALSYGARVLVREGALGVSPASTTLVAGCVGFVTPLIFVLAGFFAFSFNLWRGSLLLTMIVNGMVFACLTLPTVAGVARITGHTGRRS